MPTAHGSSWRGSSVAWAKQGEAKTELAKAERLGLPPEVEQNVRRFSATLTRPMRHGLTVELTAGPDSNVNRVDEQPVHRHHHRARSSSTPTLASNQARGRHWQRARLFAATRLGGVQTCSSMRACGPISRPSRASTTSSCASTAGRKCNLGKAAIATLGAVSSGAGTARHPFRLESAARSMLIVPLGAATQLGTQRKQRQTDDRSQHRPGWLANRGQRRSAAAIQRRCRPLAQFRYVTAALDARVRPESLRQVGGGLLLAHAVAAPSLCSARSTTTARTGWSRCSCSARRAATDRWDLIGGRDFQQSQARRIRAADARDAQRQQRQHRALRLPANPAGLRVTRI